MVLRLVTKESWSRGHSKVRQIGRVVTIQFLSIRQTFIAISKNKNNLNRKDLFGLAVLEDPAHGWPSTLGQNIMAAGQCDFMAARKLREGECNVQLAFSVFSFYSV